jgi:hypothetical protein
LELAQKPLRASFALSIDIDWQLINGSVEDLEVFDRNPEGRGARLVRSADDSNADGILVVLGRLCNRGARVIEALGKSAIAEADALSERAEALQHRLHIDKLLEDE